MSERMQILEDTMVELNKYTNMQPWRPSLMDLWVYDKLITMHESDYENGSSIPDFIWHKKPDEIMETIIASDKIFDMEYGWDDFDEQVRDYLIINDFIADPMEVSDEEYQNNLEGK
mgnify:CR=1 FL=1